MPGTPDSFAAALADRYRVERELGRGGMATVYLAHDLRHDRPVAIKVLRPELAAAIGPERFLQEIRIAARLRHPHILPVHDSGEADGRLWYAMPFVEGESLRDRLAREGHLPLDHALRIATQVLGALGYAHDHGVVHRDIKPENILLEGDQAVVADFGVARAVSAAGQAPLTQTGLAIGTPAYMSPEQATATRELDGRSDLYAMGCVLYEMLAGQAPFQGTNPQQLLARHLADTPPPIRTVRTTVPEGVERAVMRALAKLPVDRFGSAAEFSEALSAPATPGSTPAAFPAARRGRRWVALAAGALAVAAAAYFLRPRATAPLDPDLVAVAPFRVGGAAPSLSYLHEGMVDLVAARLTGEGSVRAADPGSVISEWRKSAGADGAELAEPAALALARRLGAGQLLVGGVVGTPDHVTLNASLVPVQPGRPRADATIEGAADSLPQLVDRLVAQLIAEGAGAPSGLDGLVNTPLPALRLYLEGRAAQRRGQYVEAVDRFQRALDLDSTFAIAGLSLATAAGWTATPGASRRGLRSAWANRDRLSARDRALVIADVGPAYPATSSLVEHLAAWERAADLAPDQPDRWYELGDAYYHEAPYLQVEGARRKAEDAFRRSVALDSGAASIGHLLEIALLDHDTAGVRHLGDLYLARDSSGNLLDFNRWRMAMGLGDARASAALRSRFSRMPLESLWRIMNHAVLDGEGLDDADSAAAAIRIVARRSSDWQRSKTYLHAFEVNRGRPAAALADTAAADEAEYGPHAALYQRVLDALYGDGDSVNGGQAAQALARMSGGPGTVAQSDLCVATLWQLRHGNSAGAAAAVRRLEGAVPGATPQVQTTNRVCAALLEATLGGGPALERLDSIMRSGPGGQRNGPTVAFTLSPAYVRSMVGISPVGFEDFANLEVARLREQQGNLTAALAAVRRRPYAYHLTDYLASTLREEGRLAALTGDRDGAIRAYDHYLALRSNPQPALKPSVEAVRAERAKLERPR